ncbi:hypothetical protein ACFL6H_01340 [Candidatus Latescibacterota bacterium]
MKMMLTKKRTALTILSLMVYLLVIAIGVLENCNCIEANRIETSQCFTNNNCECCSGNTSEPVMMTMTGSIPSHNEIIGKSDYTCFVTHTFLDDHVGFAKDDISVSAFSDIYFLADISGLSSAIYSRHEKSTGTTLFWKPNTFLTSTVLLI